MNPRQRAFLCAVVTAQQGAPAEGWLVFSLDPAPEPGGGAGEGTEVIVLDGLRDAGWSTRGALSTLRALLERGLVDIRQGVVRLPDGTLAGRVGTRALELGIAVARTGC
ncbi:hypothetical protein ACIRBX_23485 [Kitasatospora sp. NPDC096147]|uniref:hypothetical protein n=1 Tax=Kitasatospora sp. NPDC096147 TaxID=3364093 RepID=UPI00380C6FCA